MSPLSETQQLFCYSCLSKEFYGGHYSLRGTLFTSEYCPRGTLLGGGGGGGTVFTITPVHFIPRIFIRSDIIGYSIPKDKISEDMG